jgi:DNA-binding transcriptional LysR family regulator
MNADLSWDEFRLVKAIADSRSLAGAAERLGLNHSTVFRRLAALETTVGARLFERSRSGYEPTAAGDEMIALATTMADSIVEFERRIAGRDIRPTGQLRVTTAEAVGQHFLPAIMAQFQAQNPGVVIELILSDHILNLSRRDAEVAIRLTNDPPETLVGRRIGSVRWAIYCRRDLAASLCSSFPSTASARPSCLAFSATSLRPWFGSDSRSRSSTWDFGFSPIPICAGPSAFAPSWTSPGQKWRNSAVSSRARTARTPRRQAEPWRRRPQ